MYGKFFLSLCSTTAGNGGGSVEGFPPAGILRNARDLHFRDVDPENPAIQLLPVEERRVECM
jgi:hypothetical protein